MIHMNAQEALPRCEFDIKEEILSFCYSAQRATKSAVRLSVNEIWVNIFIDNVNNGKFRS